MGAGGALILGGIYSSVKLNSINNDEGFVAYRRGLSGDQDVCAEADAGRVVSDAPPPSEISDMCSSISLFTPLQWVFYGLGAAATGVGVYLLVTEPNEKGSARKPRVQPLVGVGPGGGRLDVRVTF